MSDIIGFLIVLFIFLFPFFVQLLNKKKRESEVQSEHDEAKVTVLPRKQEPSGFRPVRKKVVSNFEFHSHLDDFKQESRIEKRNIQTKVAPDIALKAEKKFSYDDVSPKISRKKKKISLKQMVIYSEIYDSTKFN